MSRSRRLDLASGLFAAAAVFAAACGPVVRADAQPPAAALSAVRAVRAQSPLRSSLPEAELDGRLASLLGWMDASLRQSGQLDLLPDDPDGITAGGRTNARMQTLKQTYWLQDNALYGAGALAEYEPAEGKQLSATWRRLWQQHFPQLCPDTQSGYVVGIVPAYDGGPASGDPNCRLQRPGDWQFFRMHQYPSPAGDAFDSLPRPIIGTDHPVDEQGQTHVAPIETTNVRDLLKYGCLRQVALGHRATAQQMFDLALAQWDGSGFINSKNAAGGSLAGTYWTRDLGFALACANALGIGDASNWSHGVTKAVVEKALWSAQSPAGGIWTNYCGAGRCEGQLPASAKRTNEIAPLVLLAYGRNIWAR